MGTLRGLNRSSTWWRYGSAAAAVVVTVALSLVMSPLPSFNNYFLLFLPAVAFAAWYGGLGPALFATGLSALCADYFFIPPVYVILGFGIGGLVDVIAFCVVALFISALIDRLNHVQRARGQLASIVEGSDDAIIGSDLAGIITRWNAGAEHMYGYRADEVIGRPYAILIPPYQPDENPEILERLQRGEHVHYFTTRRRRKDGTLLDISLTISPIYNPAGQRIGLSRIGRDITERKRAEDAQHASEARFRSLFENMLNGLIYCKVEFDQGHAQDFIFLDVNHAFETLTGLKNVVGRKLSEIVPGIRESEPELFGIGERVALTGQPEQCEINVRSLNMWLSLSVYSPAKEYFIAVFDVITERKLAEARNRELTQALERQNAQIQSYATLLEQNVAERTRELEEALHQLQRAATAKSRMLSNVSHEMRTPLSSIIGFSSLLLQRDVVADTRTRYLEAINGEGRRLLSLINDFLDLQHFYTDHQVLRLESFDLTELLQVTAQRYNAAGQHQWLIRLDVPPRLPVCADRERIQQVILNLVTNAIKFSPAGGDIILSARREGQAIFFSIRDHGLGIPKEELAQLFEPFQRGESAERLRLVGTGLGLALCREIVEAHHGHIWAESTGLNEGAIFSFLLPNAAASLPIETLKADCPRTSS